MKPEIYISTDVETDGPIPGPHSMLSIGSAAYLADKRHDGPLTSAEKTEQTRLKGLSAKVQTIRAVQAQRASEIVATGVASTPWPT